MEILEVNEDTKNEVERSIKKFGFTVEHHYPYYNYQQTPYKSNVFFKYDKNMGILAQKTKQNVYYTVSEVLAPPHLRKEVYLGFLDKVFRNGSNKVWSELRTDFRNSLMNDPRFNNSYRTTGLTFSLNWPVFDMKKWDGHNLAGKKWKKMRNLINRVKSSHEVTFGSATDFPQKSLIKILDDWVKLRSADEVIDRQQYVNIIKNDFKGFDHTRVIALDGKPCAITAGWETVHKDTYYSNLGILNYKCSGLGEFANWDDLACLKKKGYRFVDFGGSDRALMRFKSKFRPDYYYKTHFYYVHKR